MKRRYLVSQHFVNFIAPLGISLKSIQTIAIYAVSIGIARGGLFLSLPFLASTLSLEEIGIVTITQATVGLLIPVLMLSGSSAVMREGVQNPAHGSDLVRAFLTLPIAFCILIFIAQNLTNLGTLRWLPYMLYIAALNSLMELILTYLRATGRDILFLLASIGRFGAQFLPAVFIAKTHGDIYAYLTGQIVVFVIVLAPAYTLFVLFTDGDFRNLHRKILNVIPYTVPLIFQNAGHWIMQSSDRYIVTGMIGLGAAGAYGLAYLIASPVNILVALLGMLIPRYFVSDYERWCDTRFRVRVMIAIGAASVAATTAALALLVIDHKSTHFLHYPTQNLIPLTAIVGLALAYNAFYIVYGNFFFFHRRTRLLATSTTVVSVFNVMLTVSLVSIEGVLGAAIATALSYLVYLGVTMWGAMQLERSAFRNVIPELSIIGATSIAIAPIAMAAQIFW